MQDDDWYAERDDNYSENERGIELEDLPAEETRTIALALFDLGMRAVHRIQQFKVSFTPQQQDDDEHDDCEFDIRVTYIPTEDVPTPAPSPDLNLGMLKAQRPRMILFSTLLLVMLALLVNTIEPLRNRVSSLLLPPTSTPQAQNPLSPYPGHLLDNPTNIVVEENKTTILQVTTGGQEKYLLVPAPVPFECPAGVMPGRTRQIGNFPVWLSGFGQPNTVLHLPSTFVSDLKNWSGWVVNFQVKVKLRYTNLILLSIDDVYHLSTPLLRDPSDGSHDSRIIINPTTPQHVLGPTGQREIRSWDISLYLPGAGCYMLNASWEEGNWEVIFAAGK